MKRLMEVHALQYPAYEGFFNVNTSAHRQPTGQITGSPTGQLWHVSKNFPAGPNKYTHTAVLEKLIINQRVKKFLHFMEPVFTRHHHWSLA
jgi:hypothetical protein